MITSSIRFRLHWLLCRVRLATPDYFLEVTVRNSFIPYVRNVIFFKTCINRCVISLTMMVPPFCRPPYYPTHIAICIACNATKVRKGRIGCRESSANAAMRENDLFCMRSDINIYIYIYIVFYILDESISWLPRDEILDVYHSGKGKWHFSYSKCSAVAIMPCRQAILFHTFMAHISDVTWVSLCQITYTWLLGLIL